VESLSRFHYEKKMITLNFTQIARLATGLRAIANGQGGDIENALQKSMLKIQAETVPLTPKDTGYLRSSIGGVGGFLRVRKTYAEIGTNVKYAYRQHEGYYNHSVGERMYMEKGVDASLDYIESLFGNAVRDTLTNQL